MENKVNNSKNLFAQALQYDNVLDISGFQIEGNLIKWNGSMIQISNVSMISTAPLQFKRFPRWSIIMFLIGLIAMGKNALVGLLIMAIAILAIVEWKMTNDKRAQYRYLQIYLNSGRQFSIKVYTAEFLNRIMGVLENILVNKENQGHNITIDLKNSEIKEFKFADIVKN